MLHDVFDVEPDEGVSDEDLSDQISRLRRQILRQDYAASLDEFNHFVRCNVGVATWAWTVINESILSDSDLHGLGSKGREAT